MAKQNDVAAKLTIGSTDKSVSWYDKTFTGVQPDAQILLETKSRLPPEKVDEHVLEIRDKAWAVFPYPCIDLFRFLSLNLSKLPCYPAMLDRIKGGAKDLDIGCCIGQDVRQLVADAAPSGNLYGAELEGHFIDLGADILKLAEADSPLAPLLGTFEFIYLGMVLHVFDWETQRTVLEHCVRLLKSEAGVMIVGRAVGDMEVTTGGDAWAGKSFRHSDETFKKLWEEIAEKTGSKFDCKALIEDGVDGNKGTWTWDLSTSRRFDFEVQRLG